MYVHKDIHINAARPPSPVAVSNFKLLKIQPNRTHLFFLCHGKRSNEKIQQSPYFQGIQSLAEEIYTKNTH